MKVDRHSLREPYDLIIIGSGPAGLTLAHKYDELTTGNVLIVESGDESYTEQDAGNSNAVNKLNEVTATGDLPVSSYILHNRRIFGGTSTVWTGWCAVLEKRAFLNGEWPFGYDELERYYPEAADILNVPEAVHTHPERPFPDNPNIVYKPYYFSDPPVRFNSLFRNWIQQNASVDILFNHTVTRIRIENGVALSVFVQESSHNLTTPVEIFGKRIVLAAGGVQNPRLLQLSLPHELPVGLFFCIHPHLEFYIRLILDEKKFRSVIFQLPSGIRVKHAIQLSSTFSNAHGLLSATFDVPRNIRTPASGANFLGRNRKVIIAISTVRAEMSPSKKNSITLSDSRRDALGQPIAHVQMTFNRQEVWAAYESLNTELVRSGLGRMKIRKPRPWRGGGHMMASTRMGIDPKRSCTDSSGRVHGVENLYVAGSSLFPAVAAAHPTLTIVALSLRLAAHLARIK